MGDRLAERDALVAVGRHVVEHGLRGTDRQRAPGQAREPHALGVRRAVVVPEQGTGGHDDRVQDDPGERRRAGAHRRLGLDREPVGAGLDEEQCTGAPVVVRLATVLQAGADHEQLGICAARDEGLHAVEDEPVVGPGGRGRGGERVEQDGRLGERERGGRSVG